MSSIVNITNALPAVRLLPHHLQPLSGESVLSGIPRDDTVEFSPLGRAMAAATEKSSLRLARIRSIREEIGNNTYETQERIAETARILLQVLS